MRDEACITALTIGPDQGKHPIPRWLSLIEVFEQAEQIPALVHASPGARIAQYELLLALCYATGVHPRTHAEYRQWTSERHPLAEVAHKLREERFDGLLDLTHPTHPFGQNTNLAPYLSAHGVGPAQLELERAGDYHLFFDHIHLHDEQPLDIKEAFAAMLAQHAYGMGGRVMAKTAWFGKPFTYAAVGRLGTRIRTLALGETLADTLRLNLAPTPNGGTLNTSWTLNRSRRTFTGPGDKNGRTPDGPADLHTVLGRSILMAPRRGDDGALVVDKVLIGAGEILAPLPPTLIPDAVFKGDKPLQPNPERALWRDAHALYAAASNTGQGSDLYSRLVRYPRPVQLWSVGLAAKNHDVTGWISDTFPFYGARHHQLRQAAQDAANWTEFLAGAVKKAATIARDLTYPNARPEERATLLKRFDPGPDLWARFEDPFHQLLEAITDGSEEDTARADFATAAVTCARSALAERLRSMPRTGHAMEALVRAEARLAAELTSKKTPMELAEAAMHPTTDTDLTVVTPKQPLTGLPRPTGPKALTGWLVSLVRTHNQDLLGELRRRHTHSGEPMASQASDAAASFAPHDALRPAYEITAYLFARYHAALPYQEPQRLYGSGDLGRALRRIGSPGGRGPADPGCDRMFKRLITPGPLDETQLEHAIHRLRADDRIPPSWAQLADDLAAFTTRPEAVQRSWARSFYTPHTRPQN
ncbi:type I-E CRISPR-associated protein Cse2/CasB [Streptomyces sp. N35]|uniref:type I-E CRISPR-associated protein Cse2/CasB n=1 Tax=Streptomyces sp. N35 TaxID=2795730 RepID=UPI0018F783AA|nr:type I-E CRISPR-associated protein Cse2/CasB [Streptomyces sp. N35]